VKRTLTEVPIGDHVEKKRRYRLVVEDDPSGPDEREVQDRMLRFMQELLDQPRLLSCGLALPKSFVVAHDGERWSFRAEAVVDQP
jgi:hypothetical protein